VTAWPIGDCKPSIFVHLTNLAGSRRHSSSSASFLPFLSCFVCWTFASLFEPVGLTSAPSFSFSHTPPRLRQVFIRSFDFVIRPCLRPASSRRCPASLTQSPPQPVFVSVKDFQKRKKATIEISISHNAIRHSLRGSGELQLYIGRPTSSSIYSWTRTLRGPQDASIQRREPQGATQHRMH
jgi:hypothetical protein